MGTRSLICELHPDGRLRCVYCHSNGDPHGSYGHGKTLARHYRDPEKVGKLIDGGSLSFVGEEIGEANPGGRIPWICCYSVRDRGASPEGNSYFWYASVEHLRNDPWSPWSCIDYVYVYDPEANAWTVAHVSCRGGTPTLGRWWDLDAVAGDFGLGCRMHEYDDDRREARTE